MKKLNMRKLVSIASVSLAVLLSVSLAWSQPVPPINISVTASNPTYQTGEPIKLQVNVENKSGSEVISKWGFISQDYHLLITFTRPDGTIITSGYVGSFAEPDPLPRFKNKDAIYAELIPQDWLAVSILTDAREFYDLSQPGTYTAQVHLPTETTGKTSSFIWIASKSQARSQSASPRQPQGQALPPPLTTYAARQELIP